MRTVRQTLAHIQAALHGVGIPDSSLESELLLSHVVGIGRSYLHAYPERPLLPEHETSLSSALERRLQREPLAYILGYREFYALEFTVRPGVLIPRPETELLVGRTLELVLSMAGPGPVVVADVGTGCGNISVALAVNAPGLRVVATDTSQIALEVARENALRHCVQDRVAFHKGDLLTPLARRMDIIVANLPYVRSDRMMALQPEVKWEPIEALDGGPDGLDTLRRLLEQAPRRLKKGGYLLLEIDPEQSGPLIGEVDRWFAPTKVDVLKDLAGRDRVLVAGPV